MFLSTRTVIKIILYSSHGNYILIHFHSVDCKNAIAFYKHGVAIDFIYVYKNQEEQKQLLWCNCGRVIVNYKQHSTDHLIDRSFDCLKVL